MTNAQNYFEVELERTTETDYTTEDRQPRTAIQYYIVCALSEAEAYQKAVTSHNSQYDKGVWTSETTQLKNMSDAYSFSFHDTILIGL